MSTIKRSNLRPAKPLTEGQRRQLAAGRRWMKAFDQVWFSSIGQDGLSKMMDESDMGWMSPCWLGFYTDLQDVYRHRKVSAKQAGRQVAVDVRWMLGLPDLPPQPVMKRTPKPTEGSGAGLRSPDDDYPPNTTLFTD